MRFFRFFSADSLSYPFHSFRLHWSSNWNLRLESHSAHKTATKLPAKKESIVNHKKPLEWRQKVKFISITKFWGFSRALLLEFGMEESILTHDDLFCYIYLPDALQSPGKTTFCYKVWQPSNRQEFVLFKWRLWDDSEWSIIVTTLDMS